MTSGALVEAARALQTQLEARTTALVRIDSQTPPSATGPVAAAAAAMLGAIPGVTVDVVESVAPVVNLVARLKGGGGPGPRLVLSGHLDTYPIGEGAWSASPLGGEVVDGRLYGRGSADMKGACVSLIGVMALLAEHRRPFPGEVVLVLAGDEERMGELGTQWLLDHRPEVRGDGVIVADVGGPRSLRLGEKGMIWLEIDAEGRQAHGAHVQAGVNAADRLIDALTALRGLDRLTPSPPADAAAVIAGAAGIAGADGPPARAVMGRVTVNVGVVTGGVSANLVPAHAHAGVDVRIPLGLSAQAVEEAAADILRSREGVVWRATRRYDPTWTSPDAAIAVACRAGAEAALGAPVWFDMRIGGSDARLWRRAGMDAVTQGLTPFNLGAPDEHCLVDELWRLTACHALSAARFLGAA
jgi:succinyl-diaminopimelate desuccinylase